MGVLQGKRRGRHVEKSALNLPSLEWETFCITLRPPDPLTVISEKCAEESNY
jgi:hypothetical protein